MNVAPAIMPRNIAGQHTGIGCVGLETDQGDTGCGEVPHGQHAQGQSVGVTTAKQHQVPVRNPGLPGTAIAAEDAESE